MGKNNRMKKISLLPYVHVQYIATLLQYQREAEDHLILMLMMINYHSIFVELGHPSFFEVQQIWLQQTQTRGM